MAQSAKCSAKAENLLTSMIILVIYILSYLILSYIGDERTRTCTNVHERARTCTNVCKRLRTTTNGPFAGANENANESANGIAENSRKRLKIADND